MSIDPETLAAYIDGELDPIAAKRVERAAEADATLAEEIVRQRRLRERLRSAFAPIANTPPPGPLVVVLRESGGVRDIAEAREKRGARALPWWLPAGGAVAAALLLGLVLGRGLPHAEGPFALQGGSLVARGETARALDAQLASAQPQGGSVRILVTFQRPDGSYCRAFETGSQAAIACRSAQEWRVQSLRAVDGRATTEYRQAGSASAALMAEAQEMMSGEPLDDAGERAAIASRWSSPTMR
ncbi:anti-sigma factor [Sphingomonas sp. DT-207]|uniref:hypothetical protein n=1 Tax=Sphingomonas sp. DT-207 TaxID=3396167 RepID=UPI003F1A3CA1